MSSDDAQRKGAALAAPLGTYATRTLCKQSREHRKACSNYRCNTLWPKVCQRTGKRAFLALSPCFANPPRQLGDALCCTCSLPELTLSAILPVGRSHARNRGRRGPSFEDLSSPPLTPLENDKGARHDARRRNAEYPARWRWH